MELRDLLLINRLWSRDTKMIREIVIHLFLLKDVWSIIYLQLLNCKNIYTITEANGNSRSLKNWIRKYITTFEFSWDPHFKNQKNLTTRIILVALRYERKYLRRFVRIIKNSTAIDKKTASSDASHRRRKLVTYATTHVNRSWTVSTPSPEADSIVSLIDLIVFEDVDWTVSSTVWLRVIFSDYTSSKSLIIIFIISQLRRSTSCGGIKWAQFVLIAAACISRTGLCPSWSFSMLLFRFQAPK